MTKEEFVLQYVLNRASIKHGNLCGDMAAEEALKAYKVLVTALNEENK